MSKPKAKAPAVFVDNQPTDKSVVPERNELGQFVTGHNGGPGRPPGSRNRLAEDFLADFHATWQQHGRKALAEVAKDKPVELLRAAVAILPKQVQADIEETHRSTSIILIKGQGQERTKAIENVKTENPEATVIELLPGDENL